MMNVLIKSQALGYDIACRNNEGKTAIQLLDERNSHTDARLRGTFWDVLKPVSRVHRDPGDVDDGDHC